MINNASQKTVPVTAPVSVTATDVTLDEAAVLESSSDSTQIAESELAVMKRKSVSGAASYMLRSALLHGVGIATFGILAAYLTAAQAGIYGIVLQIVGILTFFSDIGLASVLIQQKQEPTLREYRSIFTVQQLLALLIFGSTVIIAASGVLQHKLGWEGELVLVALGLSFPLTTLKTISSVMLERRLEFNKLVIPQIFEQLVYSGVLIFFALRGAGVMTYFYAVLSRTVVGVVIMFLLQPWQIGLAWDGSVLKSLVGVGAKFQLNDFLARIKDQLYYLTLGLYLPNTEFGYISFAKTYSQLPYQLTVQNVIAITFPTYARLQHQPQLLKKAIEKTIFFISLAIFPLLAGMSIFIDPIMELVPRYHKWQPALFTFILFTLSIGWGAISTPLTNTLNAIGKINTTLKLMIMWTTLTWTITPLAVWWWGFNGVALAALMISFTSVASVWAVQQVISVSIWEQVWRQLLAVSFMAAVGVAGLPLWRQSFVWLGVGMVMSSLGYATALAVVGWSKVKNEVLSLRSKA